MGRTIVAVDDELCLRVMERYNLRTKREAVDYALRYLAGEPLDVENVRSLRGSGWSGDLDEMRAMRVL